MSTRAWLGSIAWVVGFNLFVALVAYHWSLSWAILILCLRHILFGIPKAYEIWRRIVIGNEQYTRLPTLDKKWPHRAWILETLVCILLTLASFVWINEPLKALLYRI